MLHDHVGIGAEVQQELHDGGVAFADGVMPPVSFEKLARMPGMGERRDSRTPFRSHAAWNVSESHDAALPALVTKVIPGSMFFDTPSS
jgi:hypothetical protein